MKKVNLSILIDYVYVHHLSNNNLSETITTHTENHVQCISDSICISKYNFKKFSLLIVHSVGIVFVVPRGLLSLTKCGHGSSPQSLKTEFI